MIYSASAIAVAGDQVLPFITFDTNVFPKPNRLLVSYIMLYAPGISPSGFVAIYPAGSEDPGARYAIATCLSYQVFTPGIPFVFDFATGGPQIMVEYRDIAPETLVRAAVQGEWG